jgi:RNA polymerase sigma-70 factor (ECF subfamily)
MAAEPEDDRELVVRAAGNPEAFGRLYRRYEKLVLGYFLRRCGSPDVAADLTGETFAGALVSLQERRKPSGPVGPWLLGIARHKLADSVRTGVVEDTARRRLAMEPIAVSDEELERIDALASDGALVVLLEELPAEQRDAIRARVLEDEDYRLIAARLKTSEQVIRQRVSRGLARLRRQIGEQQ